MDKKQLSERDVCPKFITPALRQAGWDELSADYILYYKPNIPLAVIEAKDNHCSMGDGLQQALEYAETRALPAGRRHTSATARGWLSRDAPETFPRVSVVMTSWLVTRRRKDRDFASRPASR